MEGRSRRLALITGASRGLGRALAIALARRGWSLIIDARTERPLEEARQALAALTDVRALPGDIRSEEHRLRLADAVADGVDDAIDHAVDHAIDHAVDHAIDHAVDLEVAGTGRLDLLVNNASLLGPSPRPSLRDTPPDALEEVYRANVFAPHRLIQLLLPHLDRSRGRIVNVTSDAGAEPYAGWGGYGSSKAALDHLTRILAAEHPGLPIYAVDPGDMNTRMHQEAFPGEDISDRPPPEESVPGILELIEGDLPSGRYVARDLAPRERDGSPSATTEPVG